ncbi:hypothetical protein PanWU01x14_113670 [Parasponia andersonii]|uniref:Uncharacterized protein n=1 Tax=Parasponia andersonii TaxID=3476 RepID=A0A2P5CXW1_PARAD|nr:hypothetical protein PanWU01x14_113670 [Parasponia andersonii]
MSFTTPLSSSFVNDTLTAYEVLGEYEFSVGLLPLGVLGYELDTSTGEFSTYLNSSCTFTIDSYQLKYKSTITGKTVNDKLSCLFGIEVKVVFLWLSIVTVTRHDDELEFSVGFPFVGFPASNFDESPTCGCGFNCVGYDNAARKSTKLVWST